MAFALAQDYANLEKVILAFHETQTEIDTFVSYTFLNRKKCVVKVQGKKVVQMEEPQNMSREEFAKLMQPVPKFETFTNKFGTVKVPKI